MEGLIMGQNGDRKETDYTADTAVTRKQWGRGLVRSWRFLAGLGLVVVIAGGLVWRHAARWESTDDAQIDGHINPISARISGQVIGVNIVDNQLVKAGAVLVQIDPTDYRVALDRAEAEYATSLAAARAARVTVPITATTTTSQLETARARVETARAGVLVAQRQLEASRALLREAEANRVRDQADLDRYQALIATGVVSRQDFDQVVARAKGSAAAVEAGEASVKAVTQQVAQAREGLHQAEADLRTALTAPQQVAVSRARADSAAADIRRARAALEQARLDLGYTAIVAPVDGIVGRKAVEKGQYVQPGQQLCVIVPLHDIWVTANFKENQLQGMAPGQPVRIRVDAYNRSYDGHVTSIGGASGARFSLFPPENATGNYVKVVQRLPVRIDIDKGQDPDHLLRPGMSVVPRVRVR
jgi:membrane fusion protein (multidrug efflux system)